MEKRQKSDGEATGKAMGKRQKSDGEAMEKRQKKYQYKSVQRESSPGKVSYS